MDQVYHKENDRNPTATMDDARLGGIPGLGTLQVVRGQKGDVLELVGTWRQPNDAAAPLDKLRQAHQAGDSLPYRGKLDDPQEPTRDTVEVEVRITSINRYAATTDDTEAPKEARTLVNFTPAGSLPYPT